jgi:hypothetical protein
MVCASERVIEQRRRAAALPSGLVDQVLDLQPAERDAFPAGDDPDMACRALARSRSIMRPVFGPPRLPLIPRLPLMMKPTTD